jgi:hypothetical protein
MLLQKFRKFDDGDTLTALGYDIVIRRKKIGELAMPSGDLVACDPLRFLETEPFELTLEPGYYPVVLLVAELRDDDRVAYATVRVKDTEPARWEKAHLVGETPDIFSSDAGYPVDSSVGCFMDADTASMMLDYTHAVMQEDDEFRRALHSQFNRNRKYGYSWANVELKRDVKIPNAGARNILCFESGWGPGLYDTWLGYDDDGELSQIVTDFEVLDLRFNTFRWNR